MAQNDNKFIVEFPTDLGSIICDAGRLRQVVGNLLSNATKFTRHGSVTLMISKQDGLVAISVKDTGVGMSPEQICSLFETFGNRGHETSSSYRDDPGLGLPLTHRLCRSMGGNLTVESEVGRGSSFTVRIPLEPVGDGDRPCANIHNPSAPAFVNGY